MHWAHRIALFFFNKLYLDVTQASHTVWKTGTHVQGSAFSCTAPQKVLHAAHSACNKVVWNGLIGDQAFCLGNAVGLRWKRHSMKCHHMWRDPGVLDSVRYHSHLHVSDCTTNHTEHAFRKNAANLSYSNSGTTFSNTRTLNCSLRVCSPSIGYLSPAHTPLAAHTSNIPK